MSAPRVIYLLSPYPFPVDFGNGAWSYGKNTPTDIAYILKSDYDELKAKLTATQSELAKIYATEPVAVYEGVEFSRYTLRWVNGDLAVGTNFYAAPIPPTDEIVEIKRQRDSAVGSLKWIHNAAKTGASIDVICGYTKGALQEVRLAAPIPPEPSPRIKDFSELRDELDAAPISPTIELATEYAEYILDHYDRKSKQDRQLLGKHLAEWADRRYRNAAPIPPDEPRLKRASLMAFGVISEIRKLVGNGKVQFVADLGGSIWTWPDAADSAITELRSVCFDAAHIPTPSQQEALDALDNMDDYARMMGLIAIGPIETLRDFILARPDTEGSGK